MPTFDKRSRAKAQSIHYAWRRADGGLTTKCKNTNYLGDAWHSSVKGAAPSAEPTQAPSTSEPPAAAADCTHDLEGTRSVVAAAAAAYWAAPQWCPAKAALLAITTTTPAATVATTTADSNADDMNGRHALHANEMKAHDECMLASDDTSAWLIAAWPSHHNDCASVHTLMSPPPAANATTTANNNDDHRRRRPATAATLQSPCLAVTDEASAHADVLDAVWAVGGSANDAHLSDLCGAVGQCGEAETAGARASPALAPITRDAWRSAWAEELQDSDTESALSPTIEAGLHRASDSGSVASCDSDLVDIVHDLTSCVLNDALGLCSDNGALPQVADCNGGSADLAPAQTDYEHALALVPESTSPPPEALNDLDGVPQLHDESDTASDTVSDIDDPPCWQADVSAVLAAVQGSAGKECPACSEDGGAASSSSDGEHERSKRQPCKLQSTLPVGDAPDLLSSNSQGAAGLCSEEVETVGTHDSSALTPVTPDVWRSAWAEELRDSDSESPAPSSGGEGAMCCSPDGDCDADHPDGDLEGIVNGLTSSVVHRFCEGSSDDDAGSGAEASGGGSFDLAPSLPGEEQNAHSETDEHPDSESADSTSACSEPDQWMDDDAANLYAVALGGLDRAQYAADHFRQLVSSESSCSSIGGWRHEGGTKSGYSAGKDCDCQNDGHQAALEGNKTEDLASVEDGAHGLSGDRGDLAHPPRANDGGSDNAALAPVASKASCNENMTALEDCSGEREACGAAAGHVAPHEGRSEGRWRAWRRLREDKWKRARRNVFLVMSGLESCARVHGWRPARK